MLIENFNQPIKTDLLSISESVNQMHKIVDMRFLTDQTFVIRMERKNISFIAGQHIRVRIPDRPQFRVYSIYSAEQDPYIEILLKEIPDGYYSPLLKNRKVGDFLEVKGPSGHFCINPAHVKKSRFLFIATGTGISPFHSYILSYPQLDYQLIHGVRYITEAYESDVYQRERLTICTTGDNMGDYHGRVTQYLQEKILDNDYLVYLCGNSLMINDAINILKEKGFQNDQIYIESYF